MLTPTGIYRYRLANTEFILDPTGEGSTASEFRIRMPAEAIQTFPELRGPLRFKHVMQLIDFDLGSVALTTLVAAPSSIVVVSSHREPIEPLLEFAARRGMDDRLAVHRGVAPDDRDQLADIADREFGEVGLGGVIDDVSTSLLSVQSAFETLFPRLAPGGSYIVRRWSWTHQIVDESIKTMDARDPDAIERAVAQTVSVVNAELGETAEAFMPKVIAASRRRPDIVAAVSASRHWLVVTRGPTRLDPQWTIDALVNAQ